VYVVQLKKSVVKKLARMPGKVANKMLAELELIAADPTGYVGDWKRLRGSSYWRLRVGQYRAICELRDENLVLLVLSVGPRGDVYK